MLALGPYRFSLKTSAYQGLRQSNDYRWATIERIGNTPVLQRIGPGCERLELEGIIYPHFRGGLGQIEALRKAALQKEPHQLINGQGQLLGKWVITHIEETQTTFLGDGTPRKIEFRLCLEKYSEAL